MNNMIFLDFDGVLFNTVKEAYAVAMIASKKNIKIDDIDFDSLHYQHFLKYRYLVGPAWNYKYILNLLEENKITDFEKLYKSSIQNVKRSEYKNFEKEFFQTRESLKVNDFDEWLKLNEPYSFLSLIKTLLVEKKDNFFIVTTKDKSTVKKLLEIEDIIINNDAIYDKEDFEKYKNKANIINNMFNKIKIGNAIFIDDSRKHLLDCENIKNLELFQANWGYVSVNDHNTVSESLIFNKIIECIG